LIRGSAYEGADLRRFQSLGREFPEMRLDLVAQGILPQLDKNPPQQYLPKNAISEDGSRIRNEDKTNKDLIDYANADEAGADAKTGAFGGGAPYRDYLRGPVRSPAELAGDQGASTPSLRRHKGKELNFANLDTLMNQAPIDYGKFKVDYTNLLEKEEARSRLAAEQSRRDAGSNALIQLGAGIAGGDMAGGLSRAGEAAMLSRREAREEEKEFGALARQIDLAERQQVSTLGIKGLEAGREQKMALAKFGLEKQQAAIQSDERVYDAYMKMKRLEQDMREAATDEERAANLAYKKSQTTYMNAFAKSREYNTAFSEEDLKAYITQEMGTAEGHQRLSGLSDKEQKDWARRELAKLLMSGGVPSMIPGATGATGYSAGVLVAGGGGG
jgi:hypothetical protein